MDHKSIMLSGEKKAILKDWIYDYGCTYTTIWKWQNYSDESISDSQELGFLGRSESKGIAPRDCIGVGRFCVLMVVMVQLTCVVKFHWLHAETGEIWTRFAV